MSGKVIHLAGERAARQQAEMLRALARPIARIPVEPIAKVIEMAPDDIDRWLDEEKLSRADFWRAVGQRRPIAIGDVADAIAALRKASP